MRNSSSPFIAPFAVVLSLAFIGWLAEGHAQDTRYWTGGSGSWSDATNWAAMPGGIGGAGVPDANDAVVIMPAIDVVVTINDRASCADLKVIAREGSITVIGNERGSLTIRGGWVMAGDVRWELGSTVSLTHDGNAVVDLHAVPIRSDVLFDGGGEWDLASALNIGADHALRIQKGTLRSHDKAVVAGRILAEGRGAKRLELGASIIQAGSVDGHMALIVDAPDRALLVNGSPRRRNGSAMEMEEFARSMVNCGTGPGQTPFTVTPSVTSNYNGFGVSCNGVCNGGRVHDVTDHNETSLERAMIVNPQATDFSK